MAFGLICQWFVLTQCTLISQESKSSRRFLSLLVCFFCHIKWFFRYGFSFFSLVYQMEEKNSLQVVILQSNYTLNKTDHFFVTLMNLACHFYLYMHRLCFMHSHIHSLFYPGFFFCIIKYFIWFIFCFTCDYTHTFHVLIEKKTTTMIQNIEQQRAYSNKST